MKTIALALLLLLAACAEASPEPIADDEGEALSTKSRILGAWNVDTLNGTNYLEARGMRLIVVFTSKKDDDGKNLGWVTNCLPSASGACDEPADARVEVKFEVKKGKLVTSLEDVLPPELNVAVAGQTLNLKVGATTVLVASRLRSYCSMATGASDCALQTKLPSACSATTSTCVEYDGGVR